MGEGDRRDLVREAERSRRAGGGEGLTEARRAFGALSFFAVLLSAFSPLGLLDLRGSRGEPDPDDTGLVVLVDFLSSSLPFVSVRDLLLRCSISLYRSGLRLAGE